jgi:hypothetical protein
MGQRVIKGLMEVLEKATGKVSRKRKDSNVLSYKMTCRYHCFSAMLLALALVFTGCGEVVELPEAVFPVKFTVVNYSSTEYLVFPVVIHIGDSVNCDYAVASTA